MKYKIKYQEKGKVYSKKIVTDDLTNEKLPSNIIEVKELLDFTHKNSSFKRVNQKELKRIFYELNLMLQSKILLNDAFEILINKEKKTVVKDFLKTLKTSFSNSSDIYKSLEDFKLPHIVKSYFKIIQNDGNIIENISLLNKIIEEDYEIKRDFRKVLTYPLILLFTYILALIGIFKFVIPKFEFIFLQNNIELSLATKSLLFTKDVFASLNIFILPILIIALVLLFYFFKRANRIKRFIDKILFNNLLIFSSLYRYKTYYIYFSVIEIFLKNKYEFHESFTKVKTLTSNKYLLDRITQVDSLLKNGKNISFAFDSVGIFDDITINLLKTGELTNSLDTAIGEIKKINKSRFDDKLKLFSLFVEPIFFIIMMLLILWIILAIFVPLWSMGDMLRM